MKKILKKKRNKAHTLLEIIISVSILSLLAIVLSKVYTISMKASIALEKFSYQDKIIDTFIIKVKRMVEKIYFFPGTVTGYANTKTMKISLECPVYLEKGRGIFEGTSLFRFLMYAPQFFDRFYYGLVITELKTKTENTKQSIYFSTVPVFFDEKINKEVTSKFKEKEYLLVEDVDKFQVEVYINGRWQSEFTCSLNEQEGEKKKNELPRFIRITVEKKYEGSEEKPVRYVYTLKLN
ncbi:MAG: prepilin-type N-terminal cleavage/methylation domain-containing protein [Planctomycetota bacterium]